MDLEMSPEIEFLGTWRPTSTETITGIELVPVFGSRHIDPKVFPAHTTISIGRVPSSDPTRFEQYPERADYFCPVMSRKHASISFSGSKAYITDTASHHGTYIERGTSGAMKVEVDEMVPLEDGDRITFGRPVHKGGKDHLPITVRVKLLTAPLLPHLSLSPPPMPGLRRSTYGLFDDDDDEEYDSECDNQSVEEMHDLPMDGLLEIPRPPPGAWPIDSPIYEEIITPPPPDFTVALSPLYDSHVDDNDETEIQSPKPLAVDKPQTEEALSKLKADVIKLQLNRKRMKARLGALEKHSSKIAQLDDASDQLRSNQQKFQLGTDSELDAIRERLHLLEERMAETDYNAAVDGLSSRNLGAEVRSAVTDDPDSTAIDKTREEIAAARDAVQSLLSELASAQRTVETQLQRLETTTAETRKRERDIEEEDAIVQPSSPRKRTRNVGEFALATAVGAAMVWTGLALY